MPHKNKTEKIIDPSESKNGIDIVRCAYTLEILGKSFLQGGVRYFISIENLKTI